ncbi:hypothetical protein MG293_014004 [Ovis ammon polii]|uniref:Uncharacterized protein n=1 Tax=Ovis ammon polii TaxID=230172 RepID=A0AAD4Y5Y9_OVIAM|nr:hypothetical protein MG293_014004 [Ovis ammon polii]
MVPEQHTGLPGNREQLSVTSAVRRLMPDAHRATDRHGRVDAQNSIPASQILELSEMSRNRSPAENTPQASRIRRSWLVSGRTKGKFFIRVLKSEPLRSPGPRPGGVGAGEVLQCGDFRKFPGASIQDRQLCNESSLEMSLVRLYRFENM